MLFRSHCNSGDSGGGLGFTCFTQTQQAGSINKPGVKTQKVCHIVNQYNTHLRPNAWMSVRNDGRESGIMAQSLHGDPLYSILCFYSPQTGIDMETGSCSYATICWTQNSEKPDLWQGKNLTEQSFSMPSQEFSDVNTHSGAESAVNRSPLALFCS